MSKLFVALVAALPWACAETSLHIGTESTPPLVVQRGTFEEILLLSGTLEAIDSTSIVVPQALGVEIRWMADTGVAVKKGDKVLEIENSTIVQELENLEQRVAEAQSAFVEQRDQNRLQLADKEHAQKQAAIALERAKLDASVPKDSYAQRTYDSMQLALAKAKDAYEIATAAVQAEKNLGKHSLEEKRIRLANATKIFDTERAKLEDYVILAPQDGLLLSAENHETKRPYQVGDKVWSGQHVMELPSLSRMRIRAQLSDVDDGRVQLNAPALCVLDTYPERTFKGHVVSISPVARQVGQDSLRRSFDVTVQLDETDPKAMRPGISVRLTLASTERADALLAPRQSLEFVGEKIYALLDDGKRVEVGIDACNATVCTVSSGLPEGTKLRQRGLP